MPTHIAWLQSGEKIEVTRKDCEYYIHPLHHIRVNHEYVSTNGERVYPTHTKSLSGITRDQVDFEKELCYFYFKPNFIKQENLMYKDELMRAIYSLWRKTKGLDVIDPDYKASGLVAVGKLPEIYVKGRKFVGD